MAPRAERAALVADQKRRLLDHLREHGDHVGAACAALGIPKHAPSHWAREDEEFAAAYHEAKVLVADRAAEQALDAAHGVDEYARIVATLIDQQENALLDSSDPSVRNAAERLRNALEANAINRDRLRADTLKWFAGVMAPKLYGRQGPGGANATRLVVLKKLAQTTEVIQHWCREQRIEVRATNALLGRVLECWQ
jgi:hypothetical protein